MDRKLRWPEEVPWYNPLKDMELKPHLSDEIWPDDPGTPRWKETVDILKRFYCAERDRAQESLDALRSYLAHPEKYLIIWGQVGIGKSWFARYELLAGENSMEHMPYHAGVIDMLTARDTEIGVYGQLQYALESYFDRFCGNAYDAIRSYIAFDMARLYGKQESESSQAEKHDIERIARSWLELRYSPVRENTVDYVWRLLKVLQYLERDELLILLIDNIDKMPNQQDVVGFAVRLLRHPQIRLIIPLRRSSQLLRNRFSAIKEVSYQEMALDALDLREMLRLRFQQSRTGNSLRRKYSAPDPLSDGQRFTFPQIYVAIFRQDRDGMPQSGELLLTHAESNAREVLAMTEKLVYSDQLKGLKHIGEAEFAVAALMLRGPTEPDTAAGLLNLFNNEEPQTPNNALVRFRVLEYFWHASRATISEERFKRYFRRLGLDLDRVRRVIELFVMTQLIISVDGFSPDDISTRAFDDIGLLQITESGRKYRELLNRLWYWVSIRKDVYLPEIIIRKEPDGREYCTNTDFVRWLERQEQNEKYRIKEHNTTHGSMNLDWALAKPHRIAAQVLKVSDRKEKG